MKNVAAKGLYDDPQIYLPIKPQKNISNTWQRFKIWWEDQFSSQNELLPASCQNQAFPKTAGSEEVNLCIYQFTVGLLQCPVRLQPACPLSSTTRTVAPSLTPPAGNTCIVISHWLPVDLKMKFKLLLFAFNAVDSLAPSDLHFPLSDKTKYKTWYKLTTKIFLNKTLRHPLRYPWGFSFYKCI